MKIFTISDIHIDYSNNKKWVSALSSTDYRDDILILAGDITDDLKLLAWCFDELSEKFLKVLFVPGNHELWVLRDKDLTSSFDKFDRIYQIAKEHNICTEPYHTSSVSIVPLLGWYDYSFASPCEKLLELWMDFRACIWPNYPNLSDVTAYFLEKNKSYLKINNQTLISFSHFLPRIDLMPFYIPLCYRYLYPALGSDLIEKQIRILNPDIHTYGHSHVNRQVTLDGIHYINNALGYPSEGSSSAKNIKCIYEC